MNKISYFLGEVFEVVGLVVLAIIVVLILDVIVAIPVYFIWNWLMPELFGLTTITFMESMGLSILCSLLFKGQNQNKTSKEKHYNY